MESKISELSGPALAWAVGIAEGCKVETWHTKSVAILFQGAPRSVPCNPHSNWSQGGPIIERERIELLHDGHVWYVDAPYGSFPANTPLIAAMRCYVASKLGDVIDIPEELAMRYVIYPYKMSTQSAKKLADMIRADGHKVLRVYPDRNYRHKQGDFIINWGSSRLANWGIPHVNQPLGQEEELPLSHLERHIREDA